MTRSAFLLNPPDCGDGAVLDTQVGAVPRVAAPVDDAAVSNQQVVHGYLFGPFGDSTGGHCHAHDGMSRPPGITAILKLRGARYTAPHQRPDELVPSGRCVPGGKETLPRAPDGHGPGISEFVFRRGGDDADEFRRPRHRKRRQPAAPRPGAGQGPTLTMATVFVPGLLPRERAESALAAALPLFESERPEVIREKDGGHGALAHERASLLSRDRHP